METKSNHYTQGISLQVIFTKVLPILTHTTMSSAVKTLTQVKVRTSTLVYGIRYIVRLSSLTRVCLPRLLSLYTVCTKGVGPGPTLAWPG
jgi:hypothetical protein